MQRTNFNPVVLWWVKKHWGSINTNDFDPLKKHSSNYLTLIANGMLHQQSSEKPYTEYPMILNPTMFRERKSREINPQGAIPDPSIVQGIYWCTHPEGRKWRSQEERQISKEGFYK